jgi:serine/threonine protein kinase
MSDTALSSIRDLLITSEMHPNVRYRVLHSLAEGGMATAFYAMRESPEGTTPAVLKVIRPEVLASAGPTAQLMIQKEAVALGRLNESVPPTPFVVRLLDIGQLQLGSRAAARLPWLGLEYVHGGPEGTTLEERVAYSVERTGRPFDPHRVAHATACLAAGLTAIHEVGVYHRDVTPGNVLCSGFGGDEVFKISDFGMARPQGVEATFGNVALGTPGYCAPEQIFDGEEAVGPWSDVFGFACIVFHMLTGEQYFPTDHVAKAFMLVKAPERRSLLDVPRLPAELRDNTAVCQALDHALAVATSHHARDRPQTADLFAQMIVPTLRSLAPGSQRCSERLLASVMGQRTDDSVDGWTWTVRHPPGDDRLVRHVAWDAEGHCLAVTTRGLEYWNGTSWLLAFPEGLDTGKLQCASLVRPGTWLVGGENGRVALLGSEPTPTVLSGPSTVTFTQAKGDPADLAVLVGEVPGLPPLLYTACANRFFRPLQLDAAARVTALSRIDDSRWLVTGRKADGTGLAAIHQPLDFHVELLDIPHTQALIGCGGQMDRGTAVAAGRQGMVIRVNSQGILATAVPEGPDLASAAVDVQGRCWVGGASQVWSLAPGVRGRWTRAWADPSWDRPIVSLRADVGVVSAISVDGAILEGRSDTRSR